MKFKNNLPNTQLNNNNYTTHTNNNVKEKGKLIVNIAKQYGFQYANTQARLY